MNISRNIIYLLLSLTVLLNCAPKPNQKNGSIEIPDTFHKVIKNIHFDTLGNYTPEITHELIAPNLLKVNMAFEISDSLRQDDWQIDILPAFKSHFHWSPHLTPSDEHIIDQHVFRAPAMIVSDTVNHLQLSIIPNLDLISEYGPRWYMDMDVPNQKLTLGISDNEVKEHVLFTKKPGTVYPPGKFEYGFYIMMSEGKSALENPWRDIASFLWERWGKPLYKQGEPIKGDLEPYIKHTYNWAFNLWEDVVWQEFELNGRQVGAPAFIVNATQSPNYPGVSYEREFRSIWNQAWFSSLRSASGLYRYAKRTGNDELLRKALMTKELALSFPQKQGLFHGLIGTEMEEFEIDGKAHYKSLGWGTHYFGNSNRFPRTEAYPTGNPAKAPFHILDMSWTAYLMLTWYEELEQDKRLIHYATTYAESLLKLQDADGFFPGWLNTETLQALGILDQSSESSMSVTFLLKLYQLTQNTKYRDAAFKCMDGIIKDIIPVGKWEDFETYWSCSRYGNKDLVNKKVLRNDMYKQNTLSIYWTAEALFQAFKITGNQKYIELGQRTLDELLMAQAVWQPPFMYVKTLGGFGVMNGDGEWNDSRQSLFAELIIKYGKELNEEEYIQRGLAALRSSFVMMYCPENPQTKTQWEARHPHFGEEDFGFMMENYGHNGTTSPEGIGIGVFTIYDWGNGAASEAYNRIVDHYGEEILSR